ncbi:DUF2066 domain-containing protein [Vibrio agarivorans]|uniref:DUF2066 domain-containing protein n=1 Tax=Vibrio agarivorans TaxID=153622 RepID=A0ABT7XXS6_9VIBR|nr:DUF2066 domain-containing protein [Vibrio agarivorans]MDN2480578.1 DUF2066 domain-containing protein [Vibrio agarivorans]
MRNIALLLMSLVSLPVLAMTQVNLYQSSIVIDQEAENGDQQARAKGLEQVIIRASGDANAASNPVIRKAMGKTSQYITQISYASRGDDQEVRLVFSEPRIKALLTQAQLPYWPAQRKTVLVWLAEEEAGQRAISWDYANTNYMSTLRDSAQQRGLPLTFPLGDFEDMTNIEVSDIWGGFEDVIEQTSQRYPADAVLVLRNDGNNVRWTLYDQAPAQGLRATMNNSYPANTSAQRIVDDIAAFYSNKDAVVVSQETSGKTVVTFENVSSAEQFFKLEKGLEDLSTVATANLLEVHSDTVTFEVELLASRTDFEQSVLRAIQAHKEASVSEETATVDATQDEFVPQPEQLPELENEAEVVQDEQAPAPTQLPEVTNEQSSGEIVFSL